jgi:methionyl-tRNA formyltransferase
MDTARVLFAGTPAFALASLQALVDAGIRPVAVLTQPDRPAGRGKRLVPGPVKRYALERGLPVLQPPRLRDDAVVGELAALDADLTVVAAYGLLLPQAVLDLPARGSVNVHASLLPNWRGAAPVQAAILAGDRTTGISLMLMTAGLDEGPVYAQREMGIGEAETAGELHDRLAVLGGELLVASLPGILEGSLEAEPQDAGAATYAAMIRPADAELDWRERAPLLARKVRAYNPVPGAWFMLGSERVKCWRATPLAADAGQPGVVSTTGGLTVACADGALSLERLQRPGRRPVDSREFLGQVELEGVVLSTSAPGA